MPKGYEMSYQEDKRELLKLKQGLIEESEIIHEEKPEHVELHGWKKVSNFFYHYKWHVIVSVFLVAVVAFFTYDIVKKEAGDIRVLVITKNDTISAEISYKTKDIELALEKYCPDFDDSGYVHVEVFAMDLSENSNPQYELAQVTKLTSELMIGDAQMFIVDKEGFEDFTEGSDAVFYDLSELYPDCEQADGIFYKIKGSGLATLANYEEACPEDLYIVLPEYVNTSSKKENAELFRKRCREVMDNIVGDNLAGWIDDDGRVYGISNDKDAEKNNGM